MSKNLVVVYTAHGKAEANLIQSLLEAEGIPAAIMQEGAGAAIGLTVGPLGEAAVVVSEDRAEEARELLAEMERGELEQGEEGISGTPATNEPYS